ncbi:hypothetical protein [Streptomyces inhibens]|uniref:hypothetical protein n=1 Tax=Streptomyces inhibens TaxID=2293571 RepID=UPI001EE71EB4|nr:hypothetical protein [Streptomyces inhibens]UKY51961.1 hypothetical protein KI385_26220 [Streptomyces inhibens]
MNHLTESPHGDDAPGITQMQLTAWLPTYPNEKAEIDEAWIRNQRGTVTSAEGITQRQECIAAAERRPDQFFCRLVRSRNEIVGLLCGRREEPVHSYRRYGFEATGERRLWRDKLPNMRMARAGEPPGKNP